ncbi:META domain-containing protein [Roseicyclus sp.]|uniref:META domain-containing protein n=1 Tax=Roseicyclus sp. TaxID=1914329 RepID=UPI003F9F859E
MIPRPAPFLGALLAALAVLPSAAQEAREIAGQAIYLARIALPPEAVLMVEATGFGMSEIAALRQPTEGAQVPLPFALDIPEGLEATLRVGIALGGRVNWLSQPIAVEAGSDDVDLGEVVLRPFEPMGFTSAFRCGERVLRVGFAGQDAILDTGEARIRLAPSEAASGARYEAPDDPGTWFWNRGDGALASVAGTQLPECRMILPMGEQGYTARGNEPFWRADVAEGRLLLVRLGFEDLDLPVFSTELTPEGDIVIDARHPDQPLRVVLVRRDGICRDDMSGMPYPESVEMAMGDNVERGCGGDPRDLIAGREWVVEDIDGQGIIDASRVTLLFGREGRVAGSGGCNRWFSGYELTGEGLSFGQAGSTMMACPEALMTQERRFFEALSRVIRHDFDETGALILHTPEGPVIRARAE